MPISRNNHRIMWCPGCNKRCYAGSKRLARHRRNQCSGGENQSISTKPPRFKKSSRAMNPELWRKLRNKVKAERRKRNGK